MSLSNYIFYWLTFVGGLMLIPINLPLGLGILVVHLIFCVVVECEDREMTRIEKKLYILTVIGFIIAIIVTLAR